MTNTRRGAFGLGVVAMGLWGMLGCGGAGLPGKARGESTALPRPCLVFAARGTWMVYDPASKKVTTWALSPVGAPGEVVGPDVFTIGAERLSPAGQVFRGEIAAGAFAATLSDDGARLAYVRDDAVEVMDVATGTVTPLGPGTAPAWSPGGDLLAFAIGARDTLRGLALSSLDGSEPRVLARVAGSVVDVDWSPDGTTLAFSTQRHADAIWSGSLYRVAATGGEPIALAALEAQDWPRSPTWSPDGQRVAFTLKTLPDDRGATRASALVVVPVSDSGALRTVVPVTHHSQGFVGNKAHNGVSTVAWSPDGAELAFTASFEGDCTAGNAGLRCTTDLYVVSASGGDRTRLTELGLTGATQVRWVP